MTITNPYNNILSMFISTLILNPQVLYRYLNIIYRPTKATCLVYNKNDTITVKSTDLYKKNLQWLKSNKWH